MVIKKNEKNVDKLKKHGSTQKRKNRTEKNQEKKKLDFSKKGEKEKVILLEPILFWYKEGTPVMLHIV